MSLCSWCSAGKIFSAWQIDTFTTGLMHNLYLSMYFRNTRVFYAFNIHSRNRQSKLACHTFTILLAIFLCTTIVGLLVINKPRCSLFAPSPCWNITTCWDALNHCDTSTNNQVSHSLTSLFITVSSVTVSQLPTLSTSPSTRSSYSTFSTTDR